MAYPNPIFLEFKTFTLSNCLQILSVLSESLATTIPTGAESIFFEISIIF